MFIWNNPPSLLGNVQLTVFYYFFLSFIMGLDWLDRVSFGEYSILCFRRIWVDWPGMGLLIFPSSCFGPNEPGLCLGCCGGAWVWHGAHCSFGLVS